MSEWERVKDYYMYLSRVEVGPDDTTEELSESAYEQVKKKKWKNIK